MKLEKYLRAAGIRSLTKREWAGVILIAVLITASCHSVINLFSDMFLPTEEITIRRTDDVSGRNTTILFEEYEHNPDELFTELKEVNSSEESSWKYVEGIPGQSWTMLVDTPESKELKIRVKKSPRKYLALLGNRGGGILEIRTEEETLTTDTFLDQDDSEILRVYIFGQSMTVTWIRIAAYLILFPLILTLTILLLLLFKSARHVSPLLLKPIGAVDGILCFLLLAGTGIVLYKLIGIPNYLQAGDETGYWQTTIPGDARAALQYLTAQFSLRGYWCYVPQTIVQALGKLISVDAAVLWILFMAAVWTFFICRVFPGMYRYLSGNLPRRVHLYPPLLILLTTQRLFLTSVLMDGLGMVTFFTFLYGLLGIAEGKDWRRSGMLAGFCASVSCSLRIAHLTAVVGLTTFFLIDSFRKKRDSKRLVEGFGIGTLIFLLVCVPQGMINYGKGHVGLFPYDGYTTYDNSEQPWYGRSITVWGSDYAMAHGNIAYPLHALDDQMHTMKTGHYHNDAELTLQQLLDIYTDSPADTLMLISKKLLIGFDQKSNINSPGYGAVPWRETRGILFSLWNYFVLFSGGFVLLCDGKRGKRISAREKWIAGLVMGLLILPQTFVKVEWRYFLPGYYLIYYFFTFYFAGPMLEDPKERVQLVENTYYLPGLALFMYGYLTMSFTTLA